MMIPSIMRASEEALKMVPSSIRDASYALGGNHWQTVLRVVVPAALPSIVTGIFLAMGRIAGETAPLLMTAFNSTFWPTSPNERTPFLTYYIYNGARSELPYEQQQAWAAAFVLLALVMVLNIGIRLATGKRVMQASRAE
jgi:phosphate transport system permease protein